ncbi:MAG TPA: lysine--tRNA ligase [bacterium]|jgi:lysyl-tRNA synthetase class 2|nr:lysine--tRNA ligase [bacterium]HNT65926.1 lysine--tRNA ligase [bacterium]HOX86034.1 lysine--tRNA ligase [bacterium]HPG44983.1 lysine--tRNA ligase [bacterium]HPM97225.1 lysine--tRNA ligase [bacterium]
MSEELLDLNEVMKIRRAKLLKLREANIEPFAYAYSRTNMTEEIRSDYAGYEGKTVSLAGRLMSLRPMGKVTFCDLMDASGRIQLYVGQKQIGEQAYEVFKLFDIGDIVGIKGQVFKTHAGEITVSAAEITLLTKNLRPLPIVKQAEKDGEKIVYDAFADTEQRYRQRYIDLNVNPQVREVFIKRSRVISAMREYLDARGYLEVETPILQPIYGGAAARPFTTHHNALDITLYMRIADELYLKRLIAGGFEGVYEISKDFRNEGIDRTHNPEFTMMELYVAYQDYTFMMNLVEEMVCTISEKLNGTLQLTYQGEKIDLTPPWRRLPMFEALQQYSGINLYGKEREELAAAAKQLHIPVEKSWSAGKIIDEIFKEKVEPNLIQPTFICDYPVELSPLAKRHRSDSRLVERFEPFVVGREIGNAFTELNDPIDQRERFETQRAAFEAGDEEAHQLDDDFIRALEVGMPPTAGLGMGVDRLVMLLTDSASIRDVIFFPTMRPEQ